MFTKGDNMTFGKKNRLQKCLYISLSHVYSFCISLYEIKNKTNIDIIVCLIRVFRSVFDPPLPLIF